MKVKLENKNGTLTLTAGDYWAGDPCYVFPKDNWGEFCEFHFKDPDFMSENGIEFFVAGTAYGDGCYPFKKAGKPIGECGVDAGILSVIPASLLKRWKSKKNFGGISKYADNLCGVFFTLEKPCEITSLNGNISFGDYSIITSEDDEDEDEE